MEKSITCKKQNVKNQENYVRTKNAVFCSNTLKNFSILELKLNKTETH